MSEPPAAAPPAVRASRHRAPRCAHLARRLPRARPGGPGHPRDAPRPASRTRATSARRDSSATTHAPRTTHRTPWNTHPTPPAHLPPGVDPRITHRAEVGPGQVSWPAVVTRANTARSAARSGHFDEHARTGVRNTERPQKHNNAKGLPRESPAANRRHRTTASDRPAPLARAPRGTFSATARHLVRNFVRPFTVFLASCCPHSRHRRFGAVLAGLTPSSPDNPLTDLREFGVPPSETGRPQPWPYSDLAWIRTATRPTWHHFVPDRHRPRTAGRQPGGPEAPEGADWTRW